MKPVVAENNTHIEINLDKQLMTLEQICQHYQLSRSFILKLQKTEGLPHRKFGRATRYKISDLDIFFQKRARNLE